MRAPKFAKGDLVRSRVNPSMGWVVSAFVNRDDSTQYLCADEAGVETIRNEGELELGERLKDPVATD